MIVSSRDGKIKVDRPRWRTWARALTVRELVQKGMFGDYAYKSDFVVSRTLSALDRLGRSVRMLPDGPIKSQLSELVVQREALQ